MFNWYTKDKKDTNLELAKFTSKYVDFTNKV